MQVCKEFFEWAATEDGQKEKIPKPDKMTPGTSFMVLRLREVVVLRGGTSLGSGSKTQA